MAYTWKRPFGMVLACTVSRIDEHEQRHVGMAVSDQICLMMLVTRSQTCYA